MINNKNYKIIIIIIFFAVLTAGPFVSVSHGISASEIMDFYGYDRAVAALKTALHGTINPDNEKQLKAAISHYYEVVQDRVSIRATIAGKKITSKQVTEITANVTNNKIKELTGKINDKTILKYIKKITADVLNSKSAKTALIGGVLLVTTLNATKAHAAEIEGQKNLYQSKPSAGTVEPLTPPIYDASVNDTAEINQ